MTSAALQSWSQTVAVVIGDDTDARDRAIELLRADGFEVWASGPGDDVAGSAPLESCGLIVLLSPGNGTALGGEIRAIAEAHPAARILIVMPSDVAPASLRRAVLAGATGVVLEPDLERTLVSTARATLTGQLAVPGVLGRVIAPRPLSHREKQILSLVVAGSTNREIARRLYLAESTVKTHLSSAFRKIDAHSRAEAVARIQDPDAGYGVGILAAADGIPT
jgi:DNA-binding NarL/FixJ family response regulator